MLISPTNILLGQAVSSIWLPGSTKLLYTAQSLSPIPRAPCNWHGNEHRDNKKDSQRRSNGNE